MNGITATNTSSSHAHFLVHGKYFKLVIKTRKDFLFQRLIDTYCNKAGIQKESVKFLRNGRLLHGDKSFRSLGLENNDIIETYISDADSTPVRVHVKIFGIENVMVEMLVEREAALENLMLAYSEYLKVSKDSVVFKLGDKMIQDEDTAASIELKDGDLIKVFRRLKRKLSVEQSTEPSEPSEPPSNQTQMSTMSVPPASAAKRRRECKQYNRRINNIIYEYYG